jgi:hypothetical protein
LDANKSVKESRDNQILIPVAGLEAQLMKKDIEEYHSFCQSTKMDRGKGYFEK